MNIIRESPHTGGGGRRRTAVLSEKQGLSRVKKLKAFSLSHGVACSGQGCAAQSLKGERIDSYPGPQPFK